MNQHYLHRAHNTPRRSPLTTWALALMTVAVAVTVTRSAGPKFYQDDPIARVPESQDAAGANPHEISLLYSISYNLFVTGRKPSSMTPAGNVNTIDELPDSSWFTDRIGARALSTEELVRGPDLGRPPAPSHWTVVREKSAGFAPGFTAKDANGELWFVSFDPPSNPEGATAAMVVATNIFWALGYNQVETFITSLRPDQVDIDPAATSKRPNGKRTPITRDDLEAVLRRGARNADGSYRIAAGRLLPGKILGGFDFEGTRSDDPNDLVPHQDHRELRALRVFGAWTNLTDMKAGNTLDTLIADGGRSTIRHFLQDVGSTFGMGANGPHDGHEGWEYVYQNNTTRNRMLSFGFALSPWQTMSYEDHDEIGLFEGDRFDPTTWKPRVPTGAFVNMRADDAFWAARRVMAFSDDAVRTLAHTGQYSDGTAEKYLADVLIKRRDKIGQAYLTAINPIVEPTLDGSGVLRFGNAAVQYHFAEPPSAYAASWFTFDNTTGATTPIGQTTGAGPELRAPSGLPSAPGAFIKVSLTAQSTAHPSWARPVDAFFTRLLSGWKLVGFTRLPDQPEGGSVRGPS